MARKNDYARKQSLAAQEARRQKLWETWEQLEKQKYSIGSITSTPSTNATGYIKFKPITTSSTTTSSGTWTVPTTATWEWTEVVQKEEGHTNCTPRKDYDDLREALIALLLRDHDGVIEFPQEMLDDVQHWKVIVDDNDRSLRIVAIPPEVHVGEREDDGNVQF